MIKCVLLITWNWTQQNRTSELHMQPLPPFVNSTGLITNDPLFYVILIISYFVTLANRIFGAAAPEHVEACLM